MNRVAAIGLFGIFVCLFVTTGCSKNSNLQRQVNSLNAQIAVITDELVRLDQSIVDLRSSLQTQQSSGPGAVIGSAVPASSGGPIYRTPSGFEVPAMDIQKALKNAGYYNGAIDGKIGSQSENAIKQFQRDHGLTVDGVVGRNTWSKLRVYLSGNIK